MSDIEIYDSLESNPIKNNGAAGEMEKILRGFEPVKDAHGQPLGFELEADCRTEYGFYWEFDDVAAAARKIAEELGRQIDISSVNTLKAEHNALYDLLPTGDVDAFVLIKSIQQHMEHLESVIKKLSPPAQQESSNEK